MAASAAALGYGAWGLWVNFAAGTSNATIAAVTQAVYSFALTLFLSLLVEMLQRVIGVSTRGLVTTVIAASASLFVSAFLLQWSVGTQHVVLTILPGWIIGSAYVVGYAGLRRRTITIANAVAPNNAGPT